MGLSCYRQRMSTERFQERGNKMIRRQDGNYEKSRMTDVHNTNVKVNGNTALKRLASAQSRTTPITPQGGGRDIRVLNLRFYRLHHQVEADRSPKSGCSPVILMLADDCRPDRKLGKGGGADTPRKNLRLRSECITFPKKSMEPPTFSVFI